ncbi:hypothetical protein AB0K74_32385 [Streptomyces sp. NPDC056159]|uniref:hypothetical protein n=1 Tax=Streptomyces sp. NPDC056159 TaxID=3155537 RepID=UPI00343FDF36
MAKLLARQPFEDAVVQSAEEPLHDRFVGWLVHPGRLNGIRTLSYRVSATSWPFADTGVSFSPVTHRENRSMATVRQHLTRAKVDIDVLDGVFRRIERTDPGVVGVIVSISGFSRTVIDEVGRTRRVPTLLVDENDLLQVLREPTSLPKLLQTKLEALVTHGRVHLAGTARTQEATGRPARSFPPSELALQDLDGNRRSYLEVPGGFTPVVFATEVADADWAFGRGRGVCLDIPTAVRDEDGLIRLLHGLDELGLTSDRPTWALQQKDTSWFGIGADALVQALDDAAARTAALTAPHHTEQLAYTDTCLGGVYTLAAEITAPISTSDEDEPDCDTRAAAARRVARCQLSFQLPGTPLDSAPLQHLFDRFAATRQGYFRPLDGAAVGKTWLDCQPVDLLARIVQHDPVSGKDWVVGLVIRDNYSVEGRDAVLEGWPLELQGSGFLVSALADHHPVDHSPDRYWLNHISTAWTSDLAVTTVRAAW